MASAGKSLEQKGEQEPSKYEALGRWKHLQ